MATSRTPRRTAAWTTRSRVTRQSDERSECKFKSQQNHTALLTLTASRAARLHATYGPVSAHASSIRTAAAVRTFASSNLTGAVASILIVTITFTPSVELSGVSTSSTSFLKSEA